jgi:hypothetical protein
VVQNKSPSHEITPTPIDLTFDCLFVQGSNDSKATFGTGQKLGKGTFEFRGGDFGRAVGGGVHLGA